MTFGRSERPLDAKVLKKEYFGIWTRDQRLQSRPIRNVRGRILKLVALSRSGEIEKVEYSFRLETLFIITFIRKCPFVQVAKTSLKRMFFAVAEFR